MRKIYLLIIDPQRDFCSAMGTLFVPGAIDDMNRLAKFLAANQSVIGEIRVTMDCHQTIHIAHPIFWVNEKGEHPPVFSVITEEDVKAGKWKPFHSELTDWALKYTSALKVNGRYDLRIWPPHCLFGTEGWNVVPELMEQLLEWEKNTVNRIHWIQKGSNFLTEQYSAVLADVPDPNDATTSLNREFIEDIAEADEILVGGEALSHCVASTVTDIANNIGEENIRKLTLLTDASSNVGGCEHLGEDFIKNLVARGMKTTTTKTWRA
jgi:nicotinamidase/pyrazinamidase